MLISPVSFIIRRALHQVSRIASPVSIVLIFHISISDHCINIRIAPGMCSSVIRQISRCGARQKSLVIRHVHGNGGSLLFKTVHAIRRTRLVSCLAQRRKKHPSKNRDDRNHDEKLDQGEFSTSSLHNFPPHENNFYCHIVSPKIRFGRNNLL